MHVIKYSFLLELTANHVTSVVPLKCSYQVLMLKVHFHEIPTDLFVLEHLVCMCLDTKIKIPKSITTRYAFHLAYSKWD